MGTRIVITENQYKRLFLGEQRVSDSNNIEITDPRKFKDKYGPFKFPDNRFTELLKKWDAIYPNALEIIDYLGENQWSNILQPAMEKVNKEKGLNLNYDNYDIDDSKTSKIDKYKYLWDVIQRDFSNYYTKLDNDEIKNRREKLIWGEGGKPKGVKRQELSPIDLEMSTDSKGRKYKDYYGMGGGGTRIYYDDKGDEIGREDSFEAQKKKDERLETNNDIENDISTFDKSITPVGTRGEDFRAMDGNYDPLKLKDPFYKKTHNWCCNDEQKQKCKSIGQVATCKTEKGSYWDEFFGYRSNPNTYHRETPMYGGHFDNKEYSYCICKPGVEKDGEFIPDNQQYISQWSGIKKGSMADAYIFNREVSLKLADHWYDEYKHEIIDLLAVVALFIPVPGLNVILSMGIEGIHAQHYFNEGDPISGWMSVIFMALPGLGPIGRRLGGRSLKKIYKIFTESKSLQKQGKSVQEIIEYTDKELSKLTKEERNFYDELVKPENIKKIENSNEKILNTPWKSSSLKNVFNDAVGNDAFWKEFKKYSYGWGLKSKFLKELMNPTMLEKYIYAGTIFGMIYLDKSGYLEMGVESIVNQLKEWGIIETPEEEKATEEWLTDLEDRYASIGDMKPDEQKMKELADEIEIHVKMFKEIPPSYSGRVDLIKRTKEEKENIYNKIKNVTVSDELESFSDWNWVKECRKNNKITKSIEITQELIDKLNSDIETPRRIKNSRLGDYQYVNWDGYWFWSTNDTNKWTLLTDCKANARVESEWDKEYDNMIDTDGEFWDLFDEEIDVDYNDIFNN